MQTREVTQILIFKLILNPMTDRTEAIRVVAISTSREKLLKWYKENKVESYKDDNWYKFFKKGSKLEWFNPMHDEQNGEYYDSGVSQSGIAEEWVNEYSLDIARERNAFLEIPE